MPDVKFKYYFILYLLIVQVFFSCREEVISPSEAGADINKPVYILTGSSYSFTVNAREMSSVVADNIPFQSPIAALNLQLVDYESGYADIKIYSARNGLIYSHIVNSNLRSSEDISLVNNITIEINFYDFSGKLKVEITRI